MKWTSRGTCKSGNYFDTIPKLYPTTACGNVSRTVCLQTCYHCTTDRSTAKDCRVFGVDAKVLRPGVTARMKQGNLSLAFLVLPRLKS